MNVVEKYINLLKDEGNPREQVYTDYVLIEKAIEILQEFEVELKNEEYYDRLKEVSKKQEPAY